MMLLLGSVTAAYSDGDSSRADQAIHQFTPAQIAKLVATASGRLNPSPEHATSLKRLQSSLEMDQSALIELLRIIDQPGITPKQQLDDLGQSAAKYHEVTATLAEMKYENADEQRTVEQVRAAMVAGRFADAENGIRLIEDTEIAAIQRQTNEGAQSAPIVDQHRLEAAQARILLGKIALLSLRYADAVHDYDVARLMLGLASTAQSNDVDAKPAAVKAFQPQQPDVTAVSAAASVVRGQPESEPLKAQSESPVTEIAVTQSATNSLPPQIVDTLVRRGDALLAIGDLTSARLLYQRAAAAGDPRGAMGVAKTYDPQVLSKLNVRGVQADPAAAAEWYRKALQGTYATATAHLNNPGQ